MSYNIEQNIIDESGNLITSLEDTELFNGIRCYLPNTWYSVWGNISVGRITPAITSVSATSYNSYYPTFIPNNITISKFRFKFGNVSTGFSMYFAIYDINRNKVADLTFTRPNLVSDEVVEITQNVTLNKGHYFIGWKNITNLNYYIARGSTSSNTIIFNKKLFNNFLQGFVNTPQVNDNSTSFNNVMPKLVNRGVSESMPHLIFLTNTVNIN